MNPLEVRKSSPAPKLKTRRPKRRPDRTRVAFQIGAQSTGAREESRVALAPPWKVNAQAPPKTRLPSAAATRLKLEPSTRSVYTTPRLFCPPRFCRRRRALSTGWSVPLAEASVPSTPESAATVVAPTLPVSFTAPTGSTRRRV